MTKCQSKEWTHTIPFFSILENFDWRKKGGFLKWLFLCGKVKLRKCGIWFELLNIGFSWFAALLAPGKWFISSFCWWGFLCLHSCCPQRGVYVCLRWGLSSLWQAGWLATCFGLDDGGSPPILHSVCVCMFYCDIFLWFMAFASFNSFYMICLYFFCGLFCLPFCRGGILKIPNQCWLVANWFLWYYDDDW